MKNKLSKKEFNLLAKDGRKVVPFFKRIMADTITPTAAWANLSMHSDYGFILESVEKAKKNGRYSYVGINPSRIFEYDQRTLFCLLYTSPSPRDRSLSRMPSSA